jgi:hypothetical protein
VYKEECIASKQEKYEGLGSNYPRVKAWCFIFLNYEKYQV